MQIDQGFPPLLSEQIAPRLLILGTLPGVRSLELQQYYAHPQNTFWWIMSELIGFDRDLAYAQRVQALVDGGVMVWDVIEACHRPGSLDSSINQETLVANDFAKLLTVYPSISCIAFNGQAARKLFKKHVEKKQGFELMGVELKVMPSTSPAYAAMHKSQKLAVWQALKAFL